MKLVVSSKIVICFLIGCCRVLFKRGGGGPVSGHILIILATVSTLVLRFLRLVDPCTKCPPKCADLFEEKISKKQRILTTAISQKD